MYTKLCGKVLPTWPRTKAWAALDLELVNRFLRMHIGKPQLLIQEVKQSSSDRQHGCQYFRTTRLDDVLQMGHVKHSS